MTEPLYRGIQGVDVNWIATIPGMEDIEELAESLPERAMPCVECNGTGWQLYVHPRRGTRMRCECQREDGGSG